MNVCRVSPFSRSDFTSLSFHFLALKKKKLLSGNISKNNLMALYKAFTFWQLSLSSTNLLFVLEIRPWAGLRGVVWEGKDKALLILSRYV